MYNFNFELLVLVFWEFLILNVFLKICDWSFGMIFMFLFFIEILMMLFFLYLEIIILIWLLELENFNVLFSKLVKICLIGGWYW